MLQNEWKSTVDFASSKRWDLRKGGGVCYQHVREGKGVAGRDVGDIGKKNQTVVKQMLGKPKA